MPGQDRYRSPLFIGVVRFGCCRLSPWSPSRFSPFHVLFFTNRNEEQPSSSSCSCTSAIGRGPLIPDCQNIWVIPGHSQSKNNFIRSGRCCWCCCFPYGHRSVL